MNPESQPEVDQKLSLLELKNSDCLEYLSTIEDESVDLVVVDPPYFKIVSADWDNSWPTESEYLDWCKKWVSKASRVLKPGGAFYVWGTTKTDTFLRFKLDIMNKLDGFEYRNWIIWSYDWGGRTKKTWPRKHEDLLMYSKGPDVRWFPEAIEVPRKVSKNIRTGEDFANGKVPTDVWTQNNHTTSKEYCNWHPTQKPIALLERVILAHTLPGDVVLDFFSGTGSTAIAAINNGRKFKGCEISKTYHEYSIERIKTLI